MKRIIALLLCLLVFFCVTGCGADPLTKTYDSVDKVVAAIVKNYTGLLAQEEAIAANESMAKYFTEEYADTEIWKLLMSANGSTLTMTDIHCIYEACNDTNWHDYINVGDGIPFGHYEFENLTLDNLTNTVKSRFNDPDSVNVTTAKIAYVMPEGVDDPNSFAYFDKDLRYCMYAEIYAKNGFGGGSNDLYYIEGKGIVSTVSISSAKGSSVQDLEVGVTFKNNRCGQAVLITK